MSFTGSPNSSRMPAFLYMCIYYVVKAVLNFLTLYSPSFCDEPTRRVRSGSAGGNGDVHLSGCRSANTHHHLETQLGTHSCQRQVGLMRNSPPRWLLIICTEIKINLQTKLANLDNITDYSAFMENAVQMILKVFALNITIVLLCWLLLMLLSEKHVLDCLGRLSQTKHLHLVKASLA